MKQSLPLKNEDSQFAIIDTHCHYNLSPLFEQWQDHWHAAQGNGVIKSVIVGTNAATSQCAIDIAEQNPHLFAAIGIHPTEFPETQLLDDALFPQSDLDVIISLASQPKVVAIGETGLDWYHLPSDSVLAARMQLWQMNMLRWHIDLAKNVRKPLILHVRSTQRITDVTSPTHIYQELLDELSDKQVQQANLPFVLHCFSGSIADAQRAVAMDGYIGVAGNSTYPNAELMREVLRQIPPNRLLTETDAPYLPPQTHRGQVCTPMMIRETAQSLAQLMQQSSEIFSHNAMSLFGWSEER